MSQPLEAAQLTRARLAHVIDRHPDQVTVIQVEPKGLDDLKAWLGIPNDLIDASHRIGLLRTVNPDHLPDTDFEYSALAPHQQQAVHDQAHNLLFGQVGGPMVKEKRIQAVIKHMLRTATPLPITVGNDLTVPTGTTYTLTTPSASFNTITIQGTGTITLSQDAKVTCTTLVYQP